MSISGNVISIVGFDPLKVDIDYITETVDLLPSNSHVDIHQAEELATRFLRCADYCSDLLARAMRYVAEQETLMKSARADAIETKIANGVSATAAKELFGNDSGFIKASRSLATATAWQHWLENKYQNLLKAHHHCKEIMKAYQQGKPAAGWGGDIGEDQYQSVTPDMGAQGIDKTKRGAVEW